jgi:hypothetical protein
MVFLLGILCLIFLCTSIIILASFPISLCKKKTFEEKKNDPFGYLFDIYEE